MKRFEVGSIFDSSELTAITNLLLSGSQLTRGPVVEEFESSLATHTGVKHAVSCSSCTAALRLSYQALGLQSTGGKVFAQINSFWNTLVPLVEFGADIHFVDCEVNSLSICCDSLEAALVREQAHGSILVVTEFGGHPSDYSRIRHLRERFNLTVIADCAHALGTEYGGHPIAQLVDISCYSFSTQKNISTLGEGGAVCTVSDLVAERVRRLKECWVLGERNPSESIFSERFGLLRTQDLHLMRRYFRPGSALDYMLCVPTAVGTNFKLSAPQAAVGITQLRKLQSLNSRRAEIASLYDNALRDTKFHMIQPNPRGLSSWHLLNVHIESPDMPLIIRCLDRISNYTGVESVNRYWPACDLSPLRSSRRYTVDSFPNYTDLFFGRLLSLPINPRMLDEDVQEIVTLISSA